MKSIIQKIISQIERRKGANEPCEDGYGLRYQTKDHEWRILKQCYICDSVKAVARLDSYDEAKEKVNLLRYCQYQALREGYYEAIIKENEDCVFCNWLEEQHIF